MSWARIPSRLAPEAEGSEGTSSRRVSARTGKSASRSGSRSPAASYTICTARPGSWCRGMRSRTHSEERRLSLMVPTPVGEETHASAARTVGRDRDALRWHLACDGSLGKVVAEVDGLRPRRCLEPQSLEYFRPHLVAGAADGGSQVNRDVARNGPYPFPEHVQASLQNPGGGPSPAGVKQSHRPPLRVNQEYRDTICRRDRQGHTFVGGGMAVTGFGEMESGSSLPVEANGTLVNLSSMHHGPHTQPSPEVLPSLQDRAGSRGVGKEPQVEGTPVDLCRGRPLDEPREVPSPCRVLEGRQVRMRGFLDDAERRGRGRVRSAHGGGCYPGGKGDANPLPRALQGIVDSLA
jgi:hypothetical protein